MSVNIQDDAGHPVTSKQADILEATHPMLCERFHDLRKIGAGSQGTMLRALDGAGIPVAIKVFDLGGTDGLKSLELFEREIETLRTLDCPGVPRFVDRLQSERYIYLVEEYIDAPSLAQRMHDGVKYTFAQIETIFRNALEILNVLGAYVPPVIHRDIKPGNLLVDDALHVHLVDFGTVADKYQKTMAMTFAGTAGYLAPEQLYSKASPASDVFALGMTFVHLVTRVSPCDMSRNGLDPEIDKYIPVNIPKWFVRTLKKMICADPTARFQNGADVLHFMDRARAGRNPEDLPNVLGKADSQRSENTPTQTEQAGKEAHEANVLKAELNKTHGNSDHYLNDFQTTVYAQLGIILFSIPIFIVVKLVFDFSYMSFLSDWLPPILSILLFISVFATDIPKADIVSAPNKG